MGKSENAIRNEILLELPRCGCLAFRSNAGQAWQSNDVMTLKDGSKLLRNPRPFKALPSGFSDIFGITTEGRFFAIEVKRPGEKTTEKQQNFIRVIRQHGGLSGVATSVEEALDIIRNGGGGEQIGS